jgi:hypothetical protein
MAAAKNKKKKLWKTGASSGNITNLKQSILETFDIYGVTLLLTPAPFVFSFSTHWPQIKKKSK